ncbi:Metallo-peptidase family M12 [Candidatus Hepatincola sp. Av]
MLPDLEIRVLFCYSPEVLSYTYYNFQHLQEDNQEICFFTQDILRRNITTYNVTVNMINTVKVDNLQQQYSITYPCLTHKQADDLALCTLQQSMQNNDPAKLGILPTHLLRLKNANNATVLVLQVVLCDITGIKVTGVSSTIGIKSARESIICLGRTLFATGVKNSYIDPTILAHELGHLMGCRHPYGAGTGFDNTNSNSHGHCLVDNNSGKVVLGTIMSYAKTITPYYSNPYVFAYPPPYQNIPCGVAGLSEACITVNNNIQKLAGIF